MASLMAKDQKPVFAILRRIEPVLKPLLFVYALLTRCVTLGVRALVLDCEGRVLLVKHTYISGWHLPGGGVERRETVETALARELREETGVIIIDRPRLISVYANGMNYIALFEVRRWRQADATSRGEIEATAWYLPNDLPVDTGAPARNRIEELKLDRPIAQRW